MGDIFIKNSDFVSFVVFYEGFVCVMLVYFFFDNVVIFFGEFMYLFFECFDIFLS